MGKRAVRALLALVVLGVITGYLRYRTRAALDAYFRGDTLTTPDLRGLDLEEARRLLGDRLRLETARQTYDPKVPRGTIITQQPGPGIRVRAGKSVFLRVSKGADLLQVPDVRNRDVRKASIALRNVGLQVGAICYLRDPRVATGTVLDHTPAAGTSLGRGGRVDLLVATSSQERRGLLPRVVGLPQEAARAALKSLGLQRIHRFEEVSETAPAGTVLGQLPAGGTFYEAGTVLQLTLSIPPDAGPPRKLLELGYDIPPGLTERTLVVTLEDDAGRRVVHRARHLPGELVGFAAEGRGAVRVAYYLDDFLVVEEEY